MKKLLLSLTVSIMAGCVGTVPVSSGGGAALVASAPADGQVDRILNSARANAGLAAVQSSAALDRVAQGHAQDMATRGYFDHTSPDGVGLGGRLSRAGLRSCTAAENIASGQATASGAMASWMASAPHRANILNRSVTAYGIGQASGNWVLVLTRPC